MSKITFRADDELIEQLEAFDASKSEVMRQALRQFLDESSDPTSSTETDTDSVDDLIAERIDAMIADRLHESRGQPQDVNVNITLDGATVSDEQTSAPERKTSVDDDGDASDDDPQPCQQCGEPLTPSHVYCPNCGEKASRRVFCECGDEIRSDWAFCPDCGRRTPAADVLDKS